MGLKIVHWKMDDKLTELHQLVCGGLLDVHAVMRDEDLYMNTLSKYL
jgi:hypothetical protein